MIPMLYNHIMKVFFCNFLSDIPYSVVLIFVIFKWAGHACQSNLWQCRGCRQFIGTNVHIVGVQPQKEDKYLLDEKLYESGKNGLTLVCRQNAWLLVKDTIEVVGYVIRTSNSSSCGNLNMRTSLQRLSKKGNFLSSGALSHFSPFPSSSVIHSQKLVR